MAMGKSYVYKKKPIAKKPIDKKQNKRLSKIERKLGQIEVKTLPQANASVAMTTIGTLNLHCNAISQGDTEQLRDGLKCVNHSIAVRYSIRSNELCSTGQFVRVVFVQDMRQVNGASPAWLTIFQTANYLSNQSILTKGRFKILYDRTHEMDRMSNLAGTVYYGGRSGVHSSFTRKLVGQSWFTGTSGTTISKNGVYMLSICNDGLDSPLLNYNVQFKFTDP